MRREIRDHSGAKNVSICEINGWICSGDRRIVRASAKAEPLKSLPLSQHVDPERRLPAGRHAVYEVKILLFKGSLVDALRKVNAQRESLQ